ncbi:protein tyrosine phosphatase family protein [Altererythrobacter sp. Root672]|uniref:protein tyrosine phosphatase family protein n=1 Tax=Altererythrobacter sp. Root672 TaxID=1736584 RepID=UPI0006FA65BC|nr:protein tyrosine phosphatase family protein [Altererythrobacter sp. Root672]KRA80745.1 hypothetical protein ASD76_16555 [Altererythrobacter sp. Root672]
MRDPDDILAWQRLSERLSTSGKLEQADPERLAEIGVKHVIFLAMADNPEALPDADNAFAAQGIGYTHIPVPFDAPEEAHYEAFAKALEATDGPVHVHCILNWRASAFCYRYNRDVAGMPEPVARALMEQQWSPERSDHPAAPQWAAFIRERDT